MDPDQAQSLANSVILGTLEIQLFEVNNNLCVCSLGMNQGSFPLTILQIRDNVSPEEPLGDSQGLLGDTYPRERAAQNPCIPL